jgi:hypothetical protein
VERFGGKIAHCIETQVDIGSIIDREAAKGFIGQRADFLISMPNVRGLLLEPGNHFDPRQITLDEKRDKEFIKVGINTRRMENKYIYESSLYDQIEQDLNESGAFKYLTVENNTRSEMQLASNYLFLLPSLVTRVERLLLHFWLKEGLFHIVVLVLG